MKNAPPWRVEGGAADQFPVCRVHARPVVTEVKEAPPPISYEEHYGGARKEDPDLDRGLKVLEEAQEKLGKGEADHKEIMRYVSWQALTHCLFRNRGPTRSEVVRD